jgi:PEGA domain
MEPPVEVAAAVPTTGTLRIDSDVSGAQVFIDRRFIGVTPLTEADVAPGPHRINAVAPGYESLAESVDVAPGPRDLVFKFKEIRLDASIAVIHKHRMGSCKGQLVATPDGLRYETTDKDDAFSVPLGSFETFEVDYLAKILKVKMKKGKRFEFSDPDANADRLFVFHRDVDKVRQRLSQAP